MNDSAGFLSVDAATTFAFPLTDGHGVFVAPVVVRPFHFGDTTITSGQYVNLGLDRIATVAVSRRLGAVVRADWGWRTIAPIDSSLLNGPSAQLAALLSVLAERSAIRTGLLHPPTVLWAGGRSDEVALEGAESFGSHTARRDPAHAEGHLSRTRVSTGLTGPTARLHARTQPVIDQPKNSTTCSGR